MINLTVHEKQGKREIVIDHDGQRIVVRLMKARHGKAELSFSLPDDGKHAIRRECNVHQYVSPFKQDTPDNNGARHDKF